MKRLAYALLLLAVAASRAISSSVSFRAPEREAGPGPGGAQHALPAFPVDFRGKPETADIAAGIDNAALSVIFYDEILLPGGQIEKEQVRLNPEVHDVRVRYMDASTNRIEELRFTDFSYFKPTHMAGPNFTLVYKFPGHPERTISARFTPDDFRAGPPNGVSAFKTMEIRAPR